MSDGSTIASRNTNMTSEEQYFAGDRLDHIEKD